MRHTARYEMKYRVSPQSYYKLAGELKASQMEPDYYSQAKPYLVRSLYFDSINYGAYHDNKDGYWGRVKLRIRSYSEDPNDSLSVEIKAKQGSMTVKYSTFISYLWYKYFMEHNHFPDNNDQVLIEFERLVHLKMWRPKVLIQYRRDGYRSKTSPDLRITFDHKVCSANVQELFPKEPFFRDHNPHAIILEIKHLKQQPQWLTSFVHRNGLKWVANSKYTQSITMSRPDTFWSPNDQLTNLKTENKLEDRLVYPHYDQKSRELGQ